MGWEYNFFLFDIHMESGYSSSLTLIIFISTGRYPRIFSVFSPLLSLSFTFALIRYESYLRRRFFFFSHSGLSTVKDRAPFRRIYFVLSARVGMLKLFDGCCDRGQHICVMKTNNRSGWGVEAGERLALTSCLEESVITRPHIPFRWEDTESRMPQVQL